MSGGRFNYLQTRHEWDEAIECIEKHIKENENGYGSHTLYELKKGFGHAVNVTQPMTGTLMLQKT